MASYGLQGYGKVWYFVFRFYQGVMRGWESRKWSREGESTRLHRWRLWYQGLWQRGRQRRGPNGLSGSLSNSFLGLKGCSASQCCLSQPLGVLRCWRDRGFWE